MTGEPPAEPATRPIGSSENEEIESRSTTIGTGSVFAIGCVAATIALILLGVAVAYLTR